MSDWTCRQSHCESNMHDVLDVASIGEHRAYRYFIWIVCTRVSCAWKQHYICLKDVYGGVIGKKKWSRLMSGANKMVFVRCFEGENRYFFSLAVCAICYEVVVRNRNVISCGNGGNAHSYLCLSVWGKLRMCICLLEPSEINVYTMERILLRFTIECIIICIGKNLLGGSLEVNVQYKIQICVSSPRRIQVAIHTHPTMRWYSCLISSTHRENRFLVASKNVALKNSWAHPQSRDSFSSASF